ncbi:MAG: bacteriorhodopsin, partial [Mycobacterium sp.]
LMVLTGLFGSLSREAGVRWAWFAISCVFFGVVLYYIVGPLKAEAATRGPDHRDLYNRLLGMLVVLWFVYPIVWAAGTEGLGEVGLSLEVAVFAVVDLLAKVGFGLLLVIGVAKIRAKDEEIVLG